MRDDQRNDLLSVNKVNGATTVLALKIGDKDVSNTLNALEARVAALETTVMQQASTIASQAQTIQGQASTISALQSSAGTKVNVRSNNNARTASATASCQNNEAAVNCELTMVTGFRSYTRSTSISGNSCTCRASDSDGRGGGIPAGACKLICLVLS